jgi:transposase-like protein
MNLTADYFNDADKAREYLEAQRWPDGPVCPHCGSLKATSLDGAKHRPGLYQCNETECREQFTVTVGTVMERSKIPLHKWLLAIHLLGSSKKGMSAHQLHRTLEITYQSAWFLCHRIRAAMADDGSTPMGGEGKIVEADETYFGNKKERRTTRTSGEPFIKKGKRGGPANKRPVVSLVERGGSVRSFHVGHATAATVGKIVADNVARETRLHTDESRLYTEVGSKFAAHETVKHSVGEYVRGEVHTNTIENFYSVFKRGMTGVYQHCSEKHLHRYLAEFDFRYNNRSKLGIEDTERAARIIKGAEGKRLTYRRPDRSPL